MANSSGSNSDDLDNLGKGLGNANFLNGLDNLSKMQPSDDSDSDNDSDDSDDLDPVKLAAEKAMKDDSYNPSGASSGQDDNESSASNSSNSNASSSSSSSSSSSNSNSSSSSSSATSKASSNSDNAKSSESTSSSNTSDSSSDSSDADSSSESQTPAQATASSEAAQVLAEKNKKSKIAEELKNNDVTDDKQGNSQANPVVKKAENVAQQNLDANKLPDEAVQELDSPNTELNKAREAHNNFIMILKNVHKNKGKLTDKDFTQIIKYANDSFNNLCKSLNKAQRQGDYRLQQIESNLQNAKHKADKGSDVLKLWEKEGLFANVSKNVAVLDQVINDPRFQTFVKTNKLNNTKLEQPTLLAKKGAQAKATLKRLGANDQHKK